MPGISIHYDLRVAAANLIIAQCPNNPLLTGLTANNIKIRMMPKVGEVVDTLPCVIVAPVQQIGWSPLGFEGSVDRTYGVEFAVVAASNQNYLANQELYEGWIEEISRIVLADFVTLFLFTNPAVPSIWNAMIDRSVTFDRGSLNINYAYQSVYASYHSQEVYNSSVIPLPVPAAMPQFGGLA